MLWTLALSWASLIFSNLSNLSWHKIMLCIQINRMSLEHLYLAIITYLSAKHTCRSWCCLSVIQWQCWKWGWLDDRMKGWQDEIVTWRQDGRMTGGQDDRMTWHNEEEKAFSISKLLSCCSAALDQSNKFKLLSSVGCEVFSVHLYSADRQGSTELITQNWYCQCYKSEAFSSLLWGWQQWQDDLNNPNDRNDWMTGWQEASQTYDVWYIFYISNWTLLQNLLSRKHPRAPMDH